MANGPGSSFSFVHAADLHLDTPFSGVHEVAPFVADELREASLAAFDAIVDLALARRAAFVVIAGDVYDGAERGLRAQIRFARGLELLSREGIASFVVHGNHDPLKEGWSAVSSWPDKVTVFGADRVSVVPVERDGETVATVQGISYRTKITEDNLALGFTRPDGDPFHVGVLHCNVGGDGDHGNYSPCTIDDLRQARLDYWALGHIHARQILAEGNGPGDPWIVYPGNSQARSPKPSEHGPKGAIVVHVADNRVEQVEFVACDRVRFDDAECSIDDASDTADLADRFDEVGRERLFAADGRSLILRAHVIGRGALHSDLARPGSLDALLAELRSRAPERPPFVWWDQIANESRPALELDEIRQRNDFAADLLRVSDESLVDEKRRRELVARVGDDAPRSLARALDALLSDDALLAEVVDEATTVAVDSVTGDNR